MMKSLPDFIICSAILSIFNKSSDEQTYDNKNSLLSSFFFHFFLQHSKLFYKIGMIPIKNHRNLLKITWISWPHPASWLGPSGGGAFLILCMSCSLCCSPVHKESASGKSAPAFNSYVWLYQCRWNGCEVFGGITGRATTFACKSQECQWAGLV